VEKAFSPLDEELGLLPGNLAPRQQEHLVHLACFMPFDKVAEMMQEMVSVQTNAETVRRLTQRMGAHMEATEVAADGEHESKEEPLLQRCAFSADGAMISLVHKQWVETRTVAIGEPQEKLNAEGEREIHVGKLSYFSRLAEASTFINLAEVEMRRRRVIETKEVGAVMDGADWCQTFTDRHRPDAVRILDFPHAAEHITKLLETLEQTGMRFPPHVLDRCLHILKHRGPQPLQRMADRLGSDLTQRKGVYEHLDYLRKRVALMQYPQFHSSGWPIGSGMVESANKNVVEARLKGTGMHWERKNVNPMLALRNAVCNDRWREMWQKAVLHHRKQQALYRSARTEQRVQALRAVDHVSSAKSPPQSLSPSTSPQPTSQKVSVPEPLATLHNISGSCAHHPPGRARVKSFPKRSSRVNPDTCLHCGTPLVQLRGRTRRYCSDRCRVRAYYQRQAHIQLLSTSDDLVSHETNTSPQRSREMRAEACLYCGSPLEQSGSRTKRYCSDRCRLRAFHQRQANNKPLTDPLPISHRVKASLARSSEACLCCGTTIGPSRSRTKRYCSDRCRLRAFHQRQANAKSLSTFDDPTLCEVKTSSQRSSQARAETCLCCGTAIEQGRRTRRYCSDRCRVRAFHQRQAKIG
jgi:predicted nucleic acid-binding Zn ribbon protein